DVELADDVRHQGLGGSGPRRRHEGLGRQVEDPVRAFVVEHVTHGGGVAEVALHQANLVREVLDVLGPAPPALDAGDLRPRLLREDEVHEMAAGEAGHAGHQDLHAFVLSFVSAAARAASYAATTPCGSWDSRMGRPTTT